MNSITRHLLILLATGLIGLAATGATGDPAGTFKPPKLWEHCLPENNLQCIALQGDAVWLGTDKGLLRASTNAPGVITSTFTTEDGLLDDDILSLAADGESVWVGTGKGVTRLRGTERQSFGQKAGLMLGAVLRIAINDKYAWLAMENGMARIEKATAKISNFPREGGWNPESGSGAVNTSQGKKIYADSIALDPDGSVWHGAFNLTHTDADGKEVRTYGCGDGLIHSRVNGIGAAADEVWCTSLGGLNRLHKKVDKFDQRFPTNFSGIANPTNRMVADGKMLWLSTPRDITRFDAEHGKFIECREASVQFGRQTILDWVADERHLWVATASGLWRLDKETLEKCDTELFDNFEDPRLIEIFTPSPLGVKTSHDRPYRTYLDLTSGALGTPTSLCQEAVTPLTDKPESFSLEYWGTCIDYPRCDGVVLWAKGSQPTHITPGLWEASGERYDGPSVAVGTEWTEVRVRFDQMNLHETTALNRVLELNDVQGITLHAYADETAKAGEPAKVWMDEIRLFRAKSDTKIAAATKH